MKTYGGTENCKCYIASGTTSTATAIALNSIYYCVSTDQSKISNLLGSAYVNSIPGCIYSNDGINCLTCFPGYLLTNNMCTCT